MANDIKSQMSAIVDFTEQLNITRTGRQRGQGNEDWARRSRRVDEGNERQDRRERVLSFKSADHTSQRGGSTEGCVRPGEMVGPFEAITSESWIPILCVGSVRFVFIKQNTVRGATGVHADDLLRGGDEVFDRTTLEVKREFDVGAWDVGVVRFKERQLTQWRTTPEIEVIQTNSAKEMTRYRGHCCPQLSFDFSERRRRQNDATIQDMLKMNTMIRSANSIECKFVGRQAYLYHLTDVVPATNTRPHRNSI